MKMTYSRTALDECAAKIKNTTWNANNKRDHKVKYLEVVSLYAFCYDRLHCILFEDQYGWPHEYLQALNRNATKKELDTMLRWCYLDLTDNIKGINQLMMEGEVNVTA